MRRWIGVGVALLVALGLTACTSGGEGADQGEDPGPSVIAPGKPGESNRTLSPEEAEKSVPNEKPNQADFAFIEDMIVHHGQAVEMTDLAAGSAVAPKLKNLADRMGAAQSLEIDAMNRWLEENGREKVMVPGAKGFDEGHAHEHGSDHGDMPGMATEAEMKDLAAVRGAKFDQLFLKLMVRHHEGALTMAEELQQKGFAWYTQKMADEIIATQSAEIATMKEMQQPG